MTKSLEFVPDPNGRVCEECGTLGGTVDGQQLDPCPGCDPRTLPAGFDESFLYRARALLFVPDPNAEVPEGCDEMGVIVAVRSEDVRSAVARRRSPVVVRDVCWPRDRKRFGELFDHHIHHADGPLVQPPNDGWDANNKLPVL